MQRTQLVERIKNNVLLTDELEPIEFAVQEVVNTDGGLLIRGLTLLPFKGKSTTFGVLVKPDWSEEQISACFLSFLQQVKRSIEVAIASGAVDEKPEEEKISLVGADGAPLAPTPPTLKLSE